MKVAVSTIGKFHLFDMARQLHRRSWLAAIYTGYPRRKLLHEDLPQSLIHTLPLARLPYLGLHRIGLGGRGLLHFFEDMSLKVHDGRVARLLRPCDVFIGLSGHNTSAGRRAQRMGAKWICDRGSTHIVHQQESLAEEHRRWGLAFGGVSRHALQHELEEYAEADYITVPSRFVADTFIARGVAPEKIRRIPYGVDLSHFSPVAEPNPGELNILFVGQVTLRKGVPYLIEAYRRIKHPRKSLTVIGRVDPAFSQWLKRVADVGVRFLGPLPQSQLKEHFSRSHVFVLPSIEEGLALVQAQALACGCPIVCTPNTGGGDIIEDGRSGYVVAARDPVALAERIEMFAELKVATFMRQAALEGARSMGGWDAYGEAWAKFISEICEVGVRGGDY